MKKIYIDMHLATYEKKGDLDLIGFVDASRAPRTDQFSVLPNGVGVARGAINISLFNNNGDEIAAESAVMGRNSTECRLFPVENQAAEGQKAGYESTDIIAWNVSPDNFSNGKVVAQIAGASMSGSYFKFSSTNGSIWSFVGKGVIEMTIPIRVVEEA